MIGGLGLGELGVIFLIVVLVFGAGKLPAAVGDLGRAVRNFRKEVGDGPGPA